MYGAFTHGTMVRKVVSADNADAAILASARPGRGDRPTGRWAWPGRCLGEPVLLSGGVDPCPDLAFGLALHSPGQQRRVQSFWRSSVGRLLPTEGQRDGHPATDRHTQAEAEVGGRPEIQHRLLQPHQQIGGVPRHLHVQQLTRPSRRRREESDPASRWLTEAPTPNAPPPRRAYPATTKRRALCGTDPPSRGASPGPLDRFRASASPKRAIPPATFRSPDPARTTPRGISTTAQDDASGVGRPSACSWGKEARGGGCGDHGERMQSVACGGWIEGPGGSIAVGGAARERAIPLLFQAVRRAPQSEKRSSCRRESGCCPPRRRRSTAPSSPHSSWCLHRRPTRSQSRWSRRG